MSRIAILGVGHVGASTAYALTITGTASDIVLIDADESKALGEALDLDQGVVFGTSVKINHGDIGDAKDSDIVIVTLGSARKPGQSRLDLAGINVRAVLKALKEVRKVAPDAVYIIVSNPVDIITYSVIKNLDLPEEKVFSTGTMLDTARLRSIVSKRLKLAPGDVNAYVFGEHGDTSVVPWSLATVFGRQVGAFKGFDTMQTECEMRSSGANIISLKGATYYAVALAATKLCADILSDTGTIHTVSAMMSGQYGIDDIAFSIPFIIGRKGIERAFTPTLTDLEAEALQKSADSLKKAVSSIIF